MFGCRCSIFVFWYLFNRAFPDFWCAIFFKGSGGLPKFLTVVSLLQGIPSWCSSPTSAICQSPPRWYYCPNSIGPVTDLLRPGLFIYTHCLEGDLLVVAFNSLWSTNTPGAMSSAPIWYALEPTGVMLCNIAPCLSCGQPVFLPEVIS